MLRDVILKQKSELEAKRKNTYIPRDAKIKGLDSDIVKVITGPRRAGKSSFAINSIKEKFGYANFDDEHLTEIQDYDELVATIDSVYDNPKTIFFDEIQNLPKWELFVNRLQRHEKNIILTGSNANLLSNELSTHLTGRYFETRIYPFSFKEITPNAENLPASEIKKKFDEFLMQGGYPEPYVKKLDVSEYLKTLFEATVYKDVIKRYRIRKTSELEAIADFLLANIASQTSFNQIAKSLGLKSAETVKKYCRILEETMVFFTVKRFSYKLKEQEAETKKTYCIDNGFFKAKAFSTSQNFGKLYENLVASELKKRETEQNARTYYWKNQQQEEVDFAVKKGDKITQLIQVCYSLENKKTQERETRALLKAGKELDCPNLLLLTANVEKTEEKEWFGTKGTIKYQPVWKWLLESESKTP
ncbi:ATP-binding protein [Candidatus Micrarchaeota archaeon]|nr:ATP-binding protein [Candidatus Micrarchaeota archaeon]